MRISLEWLNQYIKLEKSVEDISRLLTFSGIEVEDVIPYGDFPETIITSKVIECLPMKGSDHLFVCQVDSGNEIIQVVCGAPNCSQGIIVALALTGSKLQDFTIKNTKIRGVESCGMLCSEKELGLSDNHSGIIILPEDTPLGLSVRSLWNLPDTIFELEVTPNRPDLLGYLGVATDLAACIDGHVILPEVTSITSCENKDEQIGNYLSLKVEDASLCQRYTARVIRNLKISESPSWLKQRLIRSGLRPINNVVDITNYVMLETGHPLHAFDYDKLTCIGNKPAIIIRKAKDGEQFYALDGKTYSLNMDNLVIADAERPVALAGVIGGVNSHITETTVNIVLESACFNHSSIRRTAYNHKISTDSSYRFERQMVPDTTDFASIRATHMILELAGGSLCEGSLDDWQNPEKPLVTHIRPERFQQVIGIALDKKQIANYLSKLGLTYLGEGIYDWNNPNCRELVPKVVKGNNDATYVETTPQSEVTFVKIEPIHSSLYFEIPPKRVDLTREADLIEEVVRLYGMDKVPQRNAVSLVMDRHAFKHKRKAADYLVYNGYHEVVNLSFTEPSLNKFLKLQDGDIRLKQIELLNPQNSNLSVMRTTLIPQLLQNANYNINHGKSNLRLFELNKVFHESGALPKNETYRLSFLATGLTYSIHWKNKASKMAFHDIRGLVEGLITHLGLSAISYGKVNSDYYVEAESQSIIANDCIIAEYGMLQPSIAAGFDIDTVELKQDIWIADVDIDKIIELTKSYQPKYQAIPRFPSVERDISFLIKSGIPQQVIADTISNTERASIRQLCLIDEYRGKQVPEGYRSLTYRIVFNHPEKTLTDEEVDTYFEIIVKNLKSNWEIQLR
jgi:phenylalanyl-tRNA synthetase beta chain